MTPAYQSGIIPEGSSDALFVTFELNSEYLDQAKQALAASPELIESIQKQFPDAAVHAVLGISHKVWHLFDRKKPQHLAPFPHFKNQDIETKETTGDIVIHVRSMRRDVSFQLANALYQAFDKSLTIVEEVSCFKYLDNRDFTGFVDGTENPCGDDRAAVALVDDDSDFNHGSYLNLMRFVHDLQKWEQEDLKTQEDTYGRTKYANEEYPSAKKSVHAHTKRTSLKDADGNSLEILRHSLPYASLSEKGLMFASYSKTPEIFNLMLKSMIEGDEHGNSDYLMKYTRAQTGNAFFVPPMQWLINLNN